MFWFVLTRVVLLQGCLGSWFSILSSGSNILPSCDVCGVIVWSMCVESGLDGVSRWSPSIARLPSLVGLGASWPCFWRPTQCVSIPLCSCSSSLGFGYVVVRGVCWMSSELSIGGVIHLRSWSPIVAYVLEKLLDNVCKVWSSYELSLYIW